MPSQAIPAEKGRNRLGKEASYGRMDEETARTVGALMGVKAFMENKEKYRDGEGYNMCRTLREIMEQSRMEGHEKGYRGRKERH